MKLIIAMALCCFAAMAQAGKEMTDEQRKVVRDMSKDCAEEAGASSDDIEDMIDDKEEMTDQGKCLQYCMMKKLNVINENGELSVSGVKDMATIITENDEEKVKKAEQYANECLSAKSDGDNECEAAFKYSKCLGNKMKADKV